MDEIELIRDFSFDAAHLLPNVPEGHKCKRLHGHTFHFKIHLKGIVDEHTGWLMDFGDIKKVVKPLIENHTVEVGCTMEAKICPDGSAVGRSGPLCEFEKCPGE